MKIIERKFLDVKTSTCHASTLALYHDKLVFAWFGGTREGAPDSSIYIQCNDRVFKMEHADQLPRWNPILFVHNDQLYLFVKLGIFCDRWQTLIYNISGILDVDFEMAKVKFQVLPAGLNGPVKTKPVVDDKGVIHCGSSVETVMDWTSYIEGYKIKKGQFVFQYRSDPLTVPKITYTDSFYGKRQTVGIIQPSLWFDSKGILNAFFRSSRGLGKIYHSVKERNSWTDPSPTDFDNPNSGIDTVYCSKNLYLVYNPSTVVRSPLVIVQLKDSFKIAEDITVTSTEEIEAASGLYSKELSYPYMIEDDSKLYLTYTYGRSKIEFVTVGI